MPSSRSRKCTCKGGPSALGGSVPSRNRTIRPSASCLRCIHKISPLWRFSNLRKLSTIHPACGLCGPKTSSYESYHWARRAEVEIHHEEVSSGPRVGVGCHQV